jgi:hypothetical protein
LFAEHPDGKIGQNRNHHFHAPGATRWAEMIDDIPA